MNKFHVFFCQVEILKINSHTKDTDEPYVSISQIKSPSKWKLDTKLPNYVVVTVNWLTLLQRCDDYKNIDSSDNINKPFFFFYGNFILRFYT